jgi:putative tryptophan/tyrosine transport system substrate-binding protein
MRRREFIAGLGSAAAWPLAARAQQATLPVIGYLNAGAAQPDELSAFHKGLGEVGYIEGRNVAVEYRWADNEWGRLPELATDLVRRRVAVIAAMGVVSARAAKAATTRIPIVFLAGGDAIEAGLVAGLNRPGGNVTGINSMNSGLGLGGKRLGFLHELLPQATRFGLLAENSAQSIIEETRTTAAAIGKPLEVFSAGTNREIEAAFAALVQKRIEGLMVSPSYLFNNRRGQVAMLAGRYTIPTIFPERRDAEIGGLMSYGPDWTDLNRKVGVYTANILKGAKPADLPVLQPTKFELVINLKTAKALGLTIPETLLATADEVIQ